MQLQFIAAVAACLSVSRVEAALTPGEAIGSLATITGTIKDGIDTLKNISPDNLPASVIELVSDLHKAEETITNAISLENASGSDSTNAKFSSNVAQDVCEAYHDFVLAYEALAGGVVGKDGFLSKIPSNPITVPVADVLQAVNSGIEGFFGLIDGLFPGCPGESTQALQKLSNEVKSSVSSFSAKAGKQ